MGRGGHPPPPPPRHAPAHCAFFSEAKIRAGPSRETAGRGARTGANAGPSRARVTAWCRPGRLAAPTQPRSNRGASLADVATAGALSVRAVTLRVTPQSRENSTAWPIYPQVNGRKMIFAYMLVSLPWRPRRPGHKAHPHRLTKTPPRRLKAPEGLGEVRGGFGGSARRVWGKCAAGLGVVQYPPELKELKRTKE